MIKSLVVFLVAGFVAAAPALGAEVIAPEGEPQSQMRLTNEDFETVLRPEPDSFHIVARIPPGTEVEILDRITLQEGKAKTNWYEVRYRENTGWVRGVDFQDGDSEMKYSVSYESPFSSSRPLAGAAF